MTVPSWLQWLAKAGLFSAAIVLAVLHDLTPQLALVLSSALVALGVTNGAQLVSQAGGLASALAPPTKAPPAPPPAAVGTVAAAVAGMIGVVCLFAGLAFLGCNASPPPVTAQQAEQFVQNLCAENAAAERVLDALKTPVDAGAGGP